MVYISAFAWERMLPMRVNDRYTSFYYALDEDWGKIEIDRKKTALLIVDMQNYFVRRPACENPSPREQLENQRWSPFYDRIEQETIPNNVKILARFRRLGMDVAFARITCQREDGRDRSLDHKSTGFNELKLPLGDPEGEIIPELRPIRDELMVMKTTDSALTGTNLRLMLHNMGIDTVVVTGVFTDQCVSCTVRSLADESFRVYLIEDATMAGTLELHQQALTMLNNIYCHVINTEELLKALGEGN